MEENSKKNIDYLIIFFLIFTSGSFSVAHRIIPQIVVHVARILMLLISGFNYGGKLKLNSSRTFWFAIISVLMMISAAINFENLSNELTVIFVTFLVLLLTSNIGFERFRYVFASLMYIITISSLFFFVLYLVFPQLNSMFVVTDLDGHKVSNIYIFSKFTNLNRNCSFFWEPGAFQTFIALAMLFEISTEKLNAKKLIVFSLGLFTTFSTTAYLVLALIWIFILNTRSSTNSKTKLGVILLLVISIIVIYYNMDYFFSYKYTSTTFGKVLQFLNNRDNDTLFTSASVRIYSVIKPIEAFFRRPFFGWGYDGLKDEIFLYTRGINTCTFVNWFATYGILYGIVMLRAYIALIRDMKSTLIGSVLLFLILFFATGSENYVRSSFFLMLAIFGNCLVPIYSRNSDRIS